MKNSVFGIQKVAILGELCILNPWLYSYLQNHPDLIIIGKAGNMNELETKLPKLQDVDVVIFSTLQYDVTAKAEILRFQKKAPSSRVICFTEHEDTTSALDAFQQGIKGYIPLSTPPKFIIQWFDDFIHHGNWLIPPLTSLKIILQYYPVTPKNYAHINLTPTEISLLVRIQNGLSISDIAHKKGQHTDLIKKHLKHICQKIDLLTTIDYLSLVP